MAGQIDTVETDFAEQQERELIGTWDYSKRLLVKCESDGKYKEEEKPSKNALNIYKVMVWLEKKNSHIIKNHAIKGHSRVVIPKELKDFIRIIGEETPIASECKQTQGEYEINYGDCMIFQHEQYPGKDKKDRNKVAEDIKSGDLTVEEIIKKYPNFKSTFQDYLELKEKTSKSDDKSISQAIGALHKEFEKIVNKAKKDMKSLMEFCSALNRETFQEMKELMKLCSDFEWGTLKMKILEKIQNSQCSYESEWKTLAMKMYDRFCSNNGSDYKDDLLNKLFIGHEKTKTCIKDFRERFEEYIKKYNYDIVSFNIVDFHNSVYGNKEEEGVNRPKFDNNMEDGLTGPMICFHDTQGFNVYAEGVKIKNGKFACKLRFDFYDHFGLDSGDVETYGDYFLVGKGFQSWYLLQHLNEYPTGCKAFVNHATHEETVEIEIE